MVAHSSVPSSTSASALAILAAAAPAHSFPPSVRLHDQALFELSELARLGLLGLDTGTWRFVPSPNGGYALVGLTDVFLQLSEGGWLLRDRTDKAYVVSTEFSDWGSRELAAMSADERRRVRQVARRWRARASVSSKKAA
jgi:hypothetical protein